MEGLKIMYTRVSTVSQNNDRQLQDINHYHEILEDKCSGSIELFERPEGKKLKEFVKRGVKFDLHVWDIDRLGRNLRDILNSIHFFTQNGINVVFIKNGIHTLCLDGKENPIAKMVISMFGVVAEMEYNIAKERRAEGIRIAKLKGKYKGRKADTKEDTLKFLSKPKNKKAMGYLKQGYKKTEVAVLTGLNRNTVTKIAKVMNI